MTTQEAQERAKLLNDAAGGRVHQDRWMLALFDRLVALREDLSEFKGEMRARDREQDAKLAQQHEEILARAENSADDARRAREATRADTERARLALLGSVIAALTAIAVAAIQTFGPR